jgi:hypothetical protein
MTVFDETCKIRINTFQSRFCHEDLAVTSRHIHTITTHLFVRSVNE